jgi:hypothetical protein
MSRFVSASLFLAVALLVWPLGLQAQDPPSTTTTTVAEPTEAELAFVREVFSYPAFQRTNPFRPLLASDSGGPRYQQLRLSSVIYVEDFPERSVATLSTARITVNEDGSITADVGESYYVRVGQTIGNVTVVEINETSIEVDVEEFGITDRFTMRQFTLLGGNR